MTAEEFISVLREETLIEMYRQIDNDGHWDAMYQTQQYEDLKASREAALAVIAARLKSLDWYLVSSTEWNKEP